MDKDYKNSKDNTEKYGEYLAEVLVTVDGVEINVNDLLTEGLAIYNLLITNKLNHESKKHYSFTFLC
jgi:hypothetical protein